MKKKNNIITSIVTAILIVSCSKSDDLNTRNLWSISKIPTNFSAVNSKYDDYNSAYSEGIGLMSGIIFSSNRNMQGDNFDFVGYYLAIIFSPNADSLILIKGTNIEEESFYNKQLLDCMNTKYDEYGPFIWKYYPESGIVTNFKEAILYSNNSDGNQNIKSIIFEGNTEDSTYKYRSINLDIINTEYNEMYPCVYDSQFYFTSDRTGNFDIYSTNIIKDFEFDSTDFELSSNIERNEILSSSSDDKCPFVQNDLMIFASNRSGGYGGFDLWFSKKSNKGWSKPINFGKEINTEFDEYRPIIITIDESKDDLMVFSSNRSGGMGGFDLYYVGIFK